MSAVIETPRGDRCGICLNDFTESDRKFTHAGGEGHDGFHRSCFIKWLNKNPTCPIDRMPVDATSISAWSERIQNQINRLSPFLANAACATSFAVLAAATRMIAAPLPELPAAELGAIRELIKQAALIAEAVAATGIVVKKIGLRGVDGMAAGAALTAVTSRSWTAGAARMITAVGTHFILSFRRTNFQQHTYICTGMIFGAGIGLAASPITPNLLTTVAIMALTSGAIAGFLTSRRE